MLPPYIKTGRFVTLAKLTDDELDDRIAGTKTPIERFIESELEVKELKRPLTLDLTVSVLKVV